MKKVIQPKTPAQQRYMDLLTRRLPPVVVAHGPAGSGKTLIATSMAIQAFKSGTTDRIIMTRPAVSMDENHGFLPGNIIEKMSPWVRPIMDVFQEHFSSGQIKTLISSGRLELSPLAYMRGRTFKDSWIICDETQNCTPNQILMVLTRLGDNSKIVLTGDLMQHDRGFESNGLLDLVQRVEKGDSSDHISIVEFSEGDVQRHPSIPYILGLYDFRKG